MKALACELPSRLKVPLSRLHVPDITSEVVNRGIVAEISGRTVWRWLSEDAIKPWRRRSWIFPRDPDFEAKVLVMSIVPNRRMPLLLMLVQKGNSPGLSRVPPLWVVTRCISLVSVATELDATSWHLRAEWLVSRLPGSSPGQKGVVPQR